MSATSDNAHPLVKVLFKQMEKQGKSEREVAAKAGLANRGLSSWKYGGNPMVANLEAALNAINLRLIVVSSKTKGPNKDVVFRESTYKRKPGLPGVRACPTPVLPVHLDFETKTMRGDGLLCYHYSDEQIAYITELREKKTSWSALAKAFKNPSPRNFRWNYLARVKVINKRLTAG